MGKNIAIQNQRVKYADSIVSGEEVITGENIKATVSDVADIKEEINGIDKFWEYYGEVDATNTENRESTVAEVVNALLAVTGIKGKIASIKYTTYDGGGYSSAYLLCKVNNVASNAGGMVHLIDLLDYGKLMRYSGSGQSTFKSQSFASFMVNYKYDLVVTNTDKTSKKVLTWPANGNTPTWADVPTSKVYQHNILVSRNNGSNDEVVFTLYCDKSTALTVSEIKSLLPSASNTSYYPKNPFLPCTGFVIIEGQTSYYYPCIGIAKNATVTQEENKLKICKYYIKNSGTSNQAIFVQSVNMPISTDSLDYTITDTVTSLS